MSQVPKYAMILLMIFGALSGCGGGEPTPIVGNEPTADVIVGPEEYGSVMDQEGNVYPTVQIGESWWMAANLLSTIDPAGNVIESYCYDDLEENCQEYGRLYGLEAAMNGINEEGARGICPEGWHVPTMEEWRALIVAVGGESLAGGKLKEAGEDHWDHPNVGADNQSQLAILPTGWFDFTGEFRGLGESCFLRSSTNPDPAYARIWILRNSTARVKRGDLHPDDAIPLRCIKD